MIALALDGPAVEPIPLAEAKAYLRLDGDAEDDLVAALVAAARITVERQARLCLIEQGWRLRRPAWPADRAVVLPLAPVLAVEAVRVIDSGEPPALVDEGLYRLDGGADPARLLLDPAVPDPAGQSGVVEIDLLCGYGASPAAVPRPLRLAILRLVAGWFDRRGDGPAGPEAALPADVRALLAPFIRPRLA